MTMTTVEKKVHDLVFDAILVEDLKESGSKWKCTINDYHFDFRQGGLYRDIKDVAPGRYYSMGKVISFDAYVKKHKLKRSTIAYHEAYESSFPRKPSFVDVLWCLAMDCSSVMNGETFGDFVHEYGWHENPDDTLKAFNACQDTYAWFKRTGFTDADIDELMDEDFVHATFGE